MIINLSKPVSENNEEFVRPDLYSPISAWLQKTF